MVLTSSLSKHQVLVISTFKTCIQVSDATQSVQIANTLNIKTVQESRNAKAIHSYVIQAY